MTDIESGKKWSIGEDELYEAAPRVRALIVSRYEELYANVKDYLTDVRESGRPADPRYLEIGTRILKEISYQYRLGQPPRQGEDDEDPNSGMDRGALVLAQFDEIEAKLRAAREGVDGG